MATSPRQLSDFTARSAFIFVGTVVKTKAATMPELTADNTAIVRVDRVVSAPQMFASLGGHDVTVRFRAPVSLAKGNTLTFFANGWIFGASVALDVVGVAQETGAQAIAGAVRGSRSASKDNALSARLASATLGVVGTVASVQRSAAGTTHISEHDPDWQEATINVDEVIKGRPGVKQATVLFPNSDDVRWHDIRKYAAGQQGIWLLQPGVKQDAAGISPKVLASVPAGADVMTSLHDADFLPLHELERVKALARK